MNHLTEYDLVQHYYGESENTSRVTNHLRECADCSRAYAVLMRDLSEIQPITPPERGADYGSRVWQSIRSSVPVNEKKKSPWFSFNLRTGLSFATACLVLISAAFFAGRLWEHRHPQPPTIAGNNTGGATNTGADQGRERVVLLVLGDHLDRSERLLVQLRHAEPAAEAPLQAEARDLLAANRLYRESVEQFNDPTLTAALDHLERVLIEVSNEPGGLTQARLDDLQKEMNTDGLLFEVRVLRSRVQSDVQESVEPKQASATKGVSI